MPFRALFLAAALLLLFLFPRLAQAATGDLAYLGGTAAEMPTAIAVSPDGTSLYATGYAGASISVFERDGSGALGFRECISGDVASTCALTPTATVAGSHSGLFFPSGVVVSPDGRSVYVIGAGDNSVASFQRDPATGALTWQGCINGETWSGPAPGGSGACTLVPKATETATGSGLGGVYALTISPDGGSVYAAATFDAAVDSFQRDPATGALAYAGCVTGQRPLGPLGSEVCTAIPTATIGGPKSGLDHVVALAVSPDGESLYAVGGSDATIARFDRDPASGDIAYLRCLTSDEELGAEGNSACTAIGGATADGQASALSGASSVAVSPDGEHVLVTGLSGAVSSFSRAVSGRLGFENCLTGAELLGPGGSGACDLIPAATSAGVGSGIGVPSAIAIGPDSRQAYVASVTDASIATFAVTASGLAYGRCLTGNSNLGAAGSGACTATAAATAGGGGSGLSMGVAPAADGLALSPDGGSLYAGASTDNAVARLARELPPRPNPTPEPTPQPQPKPSNAFSIGKLQGGKLAVTVGAAGKVTLADARSAKRLLRSATATAGGPATVQLPLKLTAAARRTLRKQDSLSLRVRITFAPSGGEAASRVRQVRMKG